MTICTGRSSRRCLLSRSPARSSPDGTSSLSYERRGELTLAISLPVTADYRELVDGPYDAIASIGTVEHVGDAQIDRYARTHAGLLAPAGGC